MKLIILQEKFKEGLNIVEKISGKSLTLPILNNVLISTKNNFLNLTTTDLEIGINWWTLAKVEKEGQITIPTRLLVNFINLLPNEKIEIEGKNEVLFVKHQNFSTEIKGFSAEEFPIIPNVAGEAITIENSLFCQSLNQVVDITSPSSARPEISGVYFLFQKDQIIMTATDSFRLAEKRIFSEIPIGEKSYSFILLQKAARELINIFGEKEGKLNIFFSPNQVMFEFPMAETSHPQIQLISRLIEGEYPNYQEIIPKKYETQIILRKNEFLNQIRLASLFSGKINEVKFKVDPKSQKIEISSRSPDLGEHRSSLPAKIKGAANEISFNHRFLTEGILNIISGKEKNPEIIFELNGGEGPGVLKAFGDESYLYVAMPIKAS